MARKIFGKIQSEWGFPPEVQMKVIVWDADIDDDDHIGTAQVNHDGTYSIEFADKKWDWSPIESITKWRPDVYIVVEVFDEIYGVWKELARSKVYSDLDVRDDQEINLFVNFSYTNSNTIYGIVKSKDGAPLKDLTISAWDEKISLFGSQTLTEPPQKMVESVRVGSTDYIGSAQTNEEGLYRILFDPSKFSITLDRVMREGLDAMRRPDIFVKVHNLEGSGVLSRSPTKQNIICQLGCRIDVQI